MDRATLARIFDSFFTTRAGSGGTGLGLTVVQTIVLSWEGAYAVRSRLGHGTEVTLYLPLVA